MRRKLRHALVIALGPALLGGAPERAAEPKRPVEERGSAKPAAATGDAPQPQSGLPPSAGAPSVRPLSVDLAALRKALATVPAIAPLASAFVPFSDADVNAALRRGGRSRNGITVWTFMGGAFAWSPRPGRELWVLSGRSGDRALLVVLEPKAGGAFTHAGTAILAEPQATIAVGASQQYPDQLLWTSCYGCAGEGGTIRSAEDGRIDFDYR